MRENPGCETDILITPPSCSYRCFDHASSQHFFPPSSIFLCDYAKADYSPNYGRHVSVTAQDPAHIRPWLCEGNQTRDSPIYGLFTASVIKQPPVYICSLIYCSAWSESPTCYFSKYFGPNVILFDGMTITGI